MPEHPDFLDEMVSQETAKNPEFPALLDEALQRREVLYQLKEARKAAGLTQTQAAVRMGTSASFVARLESAGGDCKLSTLQRFASAVGMRLDVTLAHSAASSTRSAA